MKTLFLSRQPVHYFNHLFGLVLLLGGPSMIFAQTLVSNSVSGTWSPTGNPYIIADTCTVPAGQRLTIQPGVVAWIGSNVTMNVVGLIQAVGSVSNHIIFTSPGGKSVNWNTINVASASGRHVFKYCDFNHATTALSVATPTVDCDVTYCSFSDVGTGISMVGTGDPQLSPQIYNCIFSNNVGTAIYGESRSRKGSSGGYVIKTPGKLVPTVKNCTFNGVAYGAYFLTRGVRYSLDTPTVAYAHPKLIANLFQAVTNTCIALNAAEYPGSSTATIINNTMAGAQTGVTAIDPWDATVQNCIFFRCTNGINTSGSLSRNVSYNNFYLNQKNFLGYPAGTYGVELIPNRNGTMADLKYNIFADPSFAASGEFRLSSASPCIDAGSPEWPYGDMVFPPSQGSAFPDLGCHGGPDAVHWLDTIPKLPVTAFMTRTGTKVLLNWGAIPRCTYQVQALTNSITGYPLTNQWANLPGGTVTATEKPTSLTVPTEAPITNLFLRVISLGLTNVNWSP